MLIPKNASMTNRKVICARFFNFIIPPYQPVFPVNLAAYRVRPLTDDSLYLYIRFVKDATKKYAPKLSVYPTSFFEAKSRGPSAPLGVGFQSIAGFPGKDRFLPPLRSSGFFRPHPRPKPAVSTGGRISNNSFH